MSADDFSREQKQYLAGFASGAAALRASLGLSSFRELLDGDSERRSRAAPGADGPSDLQSQAWATTIADGGKLCREEAAKRAKDPLGMWSQIRANSRRGGSPSGTDVFLYKYFGLFWVAPAQDSFMCRLRFPGGLLDASQARGVADLARTLGGGHVDMTTRANLQVREIAPTNASRFLEGLRELGIVNRGAGADNVRNITGSPTAGFDPHELIDVRPFCRDLHWSITEDRELYGLPRKFNVAFDGGGSVGVLEDTNDIGFSAVRVRPGAAVPEGVAFRVLLGGITGHETFASDTGVVVTPDRAVDTAIAMIRVFIREGDRTDRKRARLKYVLERLGVERFLEATESELGASLPRVSSADGEARRVPAPTAHIGFHSQVQADRLWAGVVAPVGRLSADQLRGLADIASEHGSGSLRLTVWQNVLIPDIPRSDETSVRQAIRALGLDTDPHPLRAGLVACTGSKGCKFAAADTKGHALALIERLESRYASRIDRPLNIHLTGCPHSCAQHFIGDIGLLATRVERGDEMIDGFDVFVGGGHGDRRAIARRLCGGVAAVDVAGILEQVLDRFVQERTDGEDFSAWVRRIDAARLTS